MSQRFDRDKTFAVFENPQNGYREAVPELAWLWTFLFGAFYLAYRQVWLHSFLIVAAMSALLFCLPIIICLFISLIIAIFYSRNAKRLLMTNYYRRGWRYLKLNEVDTF